MRPATFLNLACILALAQPVGIAAECSLESHNELTSVVSAAVPSHDTAAAATLVKQSHLAKKAQEESGLQPYLDESGRVLAISWPWAQAIFSPLANKTGILQQLHVRLQP